MKPVQVHLFHDRYFQLSSQDGKLHLRLFRMSRIDKILRRIPLHTSKGLEIGPLANPVVKKSENVSIRYVDYADSDSLRKKYADDPNVETSRIVEVDDQWGEKSLVDLYGPEAFDYVIASHVIEHVPDMIGWLQEIAEILKEGGLLSLAVPDKRYTFDLQRPVSTPGAFIEAYLRKSIQPGPQAVFDHHALAADVGALAAWKETILINDLRPYHSPREAYEKAALAFSSGVYEDSHVWIFTPSSFLDVLQIFCRLGLCDFVVEDFLDTARNQIEFFVVLKKVSRSCSPEEQLEDQLESLRMAVRKTSYAVTWRSS
ncbi:MAG: class I SAM-dependent methyltransferase [Anaerolineales bacterium]|nr:class I SAM-dependent methyltransferase [Anaerolineales bacterium]